MIAFSLRELSLQCWKYPPRDEPCLVGVRCHHLRRAHHEELRPLIGEILERLQRVLLDVEVGSFLVDRSPLVRRSEKVRAVEVVVDRMKEFMPERLLKKSPDSW